MAIHVVQTGESLWLISKWYGVPTQTIVQVNGLINAAKLIPGLALYIPQMEAPLRYYQIKPGDVIWEIANRFNTTVQQIIMANPGINSEQIVIGQRIVIPSPNKLKIQTLGFVVPYAIESFLPTFESIARNLTYIAIVSYSFTAEGTLTFLLDDTAILEKSIQLNVAPLLMIRNLVDNDFSSELVGQVLENAGKRKRLIAEILETITVKNYAGVSIDFEFIPPPRRNDFVLFLQELKRAMGERILHVNVHSKSEDIPTNPIIGAYDYKEIGNVADIVAVMTIDYGYPTGPPDPISPYWWLEQVIQYSLTQIPANKLQVAFPLYGYDWKLPENKTSALTQLAAQNLAISRGASIQFNSIAKSPYFRYWRGIEEHIVWFEDIRSFVEKYKLIDVYNLLGVTYWQIIYPFPQNWVYMDQTINVDKLPK